MPFSIKDETVENLLLHPGELIAEVQEVNYDPERCLTIGLPDHAPLFQLAHSSGK